MYERYLVFVLIDNIWVSSLSKGKTVQELIKGYERRSEVFDGFRIERYLGDETITLYSDRRKPCSPLSA